jgi:deoxycytidylate deaminase
MSKDPTTKVGAVIVTPDNRQCSIGYNGFAKGIEETEEKWERPTKYEYVIHSEMNAIMNCPFDTHGCTVYITMTPCHRCITHLVNAGIKRIVYEHEYDRLAHVDIWKEAASLFDEVVCLKDCDDSSKCEPNCEEGCQ